tara:strand:+ start:94105 stop:94233 length:129 start_codon:yes stop_codon:yes gene_type:complete
MKKINGSLNKGTKEEDKLKNKKSKKKKSAKAKKFESKTVVTA